MVGKKYRLGGFGNPITYLVTSNLVTKSISKLMSPYEVMGLHKDFVCVSVLIEPD